MANVLKMAKIQAIVELRRQGWSLRRIARELGIHRDTVCRYVAETGAKPANPTAGAEGESGPKPAKVTAGSLRGPPKEAADEPSPSALSPVRCATPPCPRTSPEARGSGEPLRVYPCEEVGGNGATPSARVPPPPAPAARSGRHRGRLLGRSWRPPRRGLHRRQAPLFSNGGRRTFPPPPPLL
jgi:hypothetical protein